MSANSKIHNQLHNLVGEMAQLLIREGYEVSAEMTVGEFLEATQHLVEEARTLQLESVDAGLSEDALSVLEESLELIVQTEGILSTIGNAVDNVRGHVQGAISTALSAAGDVAGKIPVVGTVGKALGKGGAALVGTLNAAQTAGNAASRKLQGDEEGAAKQTANAKKIAADTMDQYAAAVPG